MIGRLCLASGVLAACLLHAGAALAGSPVVDATGRPVDVGDTSRIVSVGGSVTEIVYLLGLADRVVAVDSTSLYPVEATAKPDVGYMRQLAAEPILSLEPSVVLAIEDSGPPEVLDQLRDAGIPVVVVPDDPSPEGVLDKIALVAEVLGVADKGRELAARLEEELEAVETALVAVPERPRVLFLLSIGAGGAPLAAGRGTAAAGIIDLAGGTNAIDSFEGYKPLSPEAAVAAAPEIILVTERSLQLLGGVDGLLRLPEISLTPAGQHRRVVAMDGLLLLGFGPRTGMAIEQLASSLHPDIAMPARSQ